MPKTLLVAWREFKATALTKAFLIGAVIVPALIAGLGILGPFLFNPKPSPLTGTVALVDTQGHVSKAADVEFSPEAIKKHIGFMAAAKKQVESSGLADGGRAGEDMLTRNPRSMAAITREFDIDLQLTKRENFDALQELKQQVGSGEILALVTIDEPVPPAEDKSADAAETNAPTPPPVTADSPTTPTINARVYVPSNMNVKHTGLIEDLVQASVARARITMANLEVETVRNLARAPQPETVRIGKDFVERPEGKGTKVAKIFIPMIFMMLIWMGAFVSANYLLTSTIEEKSNKVMEVLLSAVSPFQLMTGKILGQAFVGLVMVGMYLVLGVAVLIVLAKFDLIDWADFIWFALYYIMAYFMIASIMAAIGSAVNELREAQSLMTPAMLVLMIPLMLWLPISDSPNGMLATITSFIPPLIPFVMILRVTGGEAIPFWQIPVTIVIGYAAMIGMMWMSAKIFRVGVLMYGKPPSPLELIKWVRYR